MVTSVRRFAAILCASTVGTLLAGVALADTSSYVTPPVARARDALARVEGQGMALQAELRSARAIRDADRARCLDDALTRMHVAARAGRSLRDSIAAAVVPPLLVTAARSPAASSADWTSSADAPTSVCRTILSATSAVSFISTPAALIA